MTSFGLYIHIPFCSSLCHYCDFAKTALYSNDQVRAYFLKLEEQLQFWLAKSNVPLTSVFFGGGTPGLFAKEYEPLMAIIQPRLAPGAEISLEANPHNVTAENLLTWKSLGFNRLSIGVQSFDARALAYLTRDHDAADAGKSIEAALTVFPSLNIDLIYGWEKQSLSSWEHDLTRACSLGVPHLSLYCLTYEDGTTLGRKLRRGVVAREPDESLAIHYELACSVLKDAKYLHEEVSNWAKPGFSCRHNWLYWSDKNFIGIGAGAHGYSDDGNSFGMRYSYPKDLKKYLSGEPFTIDERTSEDWLLEYIGSSLRTERGSDLALIQAKTGLVFRPNALINRGLNEKSISIDQSIRLVPREWFRESAWALQVVDCLT